MRNYILPILVYLLCYQSPAQTVPFITEFRTDFGIEKLDLRFRPTFYFMTKERMRREVFLGYSINKTTKIFSYSRYNDYEKKFYTGFRFDKKIYFTDKISLNNQFRYLTSPADQSDSDIGIYIPDLLYNLKNFSIGLRAFLVNRIESLDKIKMTKPYVGPAMIMKEEKFITMVTFLPDVNQHSEDYLFMALFIFKL